MGPLYGTTAVNCIFSDPLFVDPLHQNYRLKPDSPCRGTGLGGVDMGAYGPGAKHEPPFIPIPIITAISSLEEDLAAVFDIAGFVLPGDDIVEKIENLIYAIIQLNSGQKIAFFRLLGFF